MAVARVAVVTGANRGLGLETARQLGRRGVRVVLGSRDAARGEAAARLLAAEGLPVVAHQVTVTDPQSVDRLALFVRRDLGRVDILVNNAGILIDPDPPDGGLDAPVDTFRETIETNVYGALRMAQALVPLMREHGYGRVVNLSSGLGQLAEMQGGWPAYRVSKAALNALTRILADELGGTNVLVNAVCPGWVRTDMGGPRAERSAEEAADGVVWAALLPDGGPTGGFFRDRRPIPW